MCPPLSRAVELKAYPQSSQWIRPPTVQRVGERILANSTVKFAECCVPHVIPAL